MTNSSKFNKDNILGVILRGIGTVAGSYARVVGVSTRGKYALVQRSNGSTTVSKIRSLRTNYLEASDAGHSLPAWLGRNKLPVPGDGGDWMLLPFASADEKASAVEPKSASTVATLEIDLTNKLQVGTVIVPKTVMHQGGPAKIVAYIGNDCVQIARPGINPRPVQFKTLRSNYRLATPVETASFGATTDAVETDGGLRLDAEVTAQREPRRVPKGRASASDAPALDESLNINRAYPKQDASKPTDEPRRTSPTQHRERTVGTYDFCGDQIRSVQIESEPWLSANSIAKLAGLVLPTFYRLLDGFGRESARCELVPQWGTVVTVRVVRAAHLPQIIDAVDQTSMAVGDKARWAAWTAEAARLRGDAPSPDAPTEAQPAPADKADANESDATDVEVMPDGMALTKYNGVALAVPMQGQGEPLIRDLTLGERLELSRARNIRRTIETLMDEGVLGHVEVRSPSERSRENRPNHGNTKESYWLNERQALLVIGRTGTPVANRIYVEMVDVFLAWRRGGHAVPQQSSVDMSALTLTVATLAEITRTLAPLLSRLPDLAKASPEAEQNAKDAETLRKSRSNAAKKAAETRDFNTMFRGVHDALEPLVHRFLTEQMTQADTRSQSDVRRCLRPHEVLSHFNRYVRAMGTRIPADEREALDTIAIEDDFRDRALYRLFNEASNHTKAEKEIEEDGKPRMVDVLPWYPKIGLVADPRQTTIPGTARP